MAIISLIAAIDQQNGLGKDNQLLCHLPADLQHFKTLTLGKPIIMGRQTFESIGKPLPGRRNIILSRKINAIANVDLANTFEEALALVEDVPEIMIIGGAAIFKQALSIASRIYLTQIHHQFDADVFFPIINPSEWICKDKLFREADDINNYAMTFYYYERANL
ncbi:MAG: dihydrofolate reductase [Tatlockia sp.]|nr:dihydrofolate reductase [Tatlockia sp.]